MAIIATAAIVWSQSDPAYSDGSWSADLLGWANGISLTLGTLARRRRSVDVSAEYCRGAFLRMMEANAMPKAWFADATIKVSIVALAKAACEIEIVSDLGRADRSERTVNVRPHDPVIERRRTDNFGPSNQKGL